MREVIGPSVDELLSIETKPFGVASKICKWSAQNSDTVHLISIGDEPQPVQRRIMDIISYKDIEKVNGRDVHIKSSDLLQRYVKYFEDNHIGTNNSPQ